MIDVDALYAARDNSVSSPTPSLAEDRAARPGVTLDAAPRVKAIEDTFLLYFSPDIEKIIIEISNKRGMARFGDEHEELTVDLLHAYFAVMLLGSVYRSVSPQLSRISQFDFLQYVPQ